MTHSGGDDETALREELSVIGLSDSEVDTYLALLGRGEATTRTVAEDADVTQRAVYDITERLEDRGLVRVNDHASPTTIRAVPPNESMTSLTDRLDAITPTLEDRFNETTQQAPEIQIVKSRETVLNRLRNALSQAQREIVLAVPEHIYPDIESVLQVAVERDVLVFLLIGDMNDPSEDRNRFVESADIVRYWDQNLTVVYVVDEELAMIGDPGLLSGTHSDEDGVVVSQRNLAGSILGLYLSGYWPASTELFVTDPDPLPQTFKWFRRALLHATLHRQRGIDLWAEIETESGADVAGSVSQIRQALIEPTTNEFTLEGSIYLETDEGEVSIGGRGSFVEDYEAKSVTLHSNSSDS